MHALVVGASGQVGGALVEALGPERVLGTTCRNPVEGCAHIDLRECATRPEIAEGLFARGPFDVLFVAAAMTNVEACESRRDEALAMNRDGPRALVGAARAAGARSVLFSTEYVFDGAAGPYGEDDAPAPISVYGRTKLAGEAFARSADPDVLILRTTVVYGPDAHGRNFAYRLASELGAGRSLNAPCDQVSSPTYNRDLAAAAIALVKAGVTGVVNVVGPETMDRATFARRLAAAVDLPTDRITDVRTESLGQLAARPLQAGLRTDLVRRLVPHIPLRSVEDAARHWTDHQRGKPWPTT